MPQQFFKRREKKYLLSRLEYDLIKRDIAANMQPDKHHISHIYTVYFDTEHNDLVIRSLESSDYKYKVRARSYGRASSDAVFLEIKSKLDGTVYKRRVKMTHDEYQKYLAGGARQDSQVMDEIDYLFRKKSLRPKMFIAYDRLAYASPDDSGLRITIDHNLRSRSDDLEISHTDNCRRYFDDDRFIMEIKSHGGLPTWLTDSLGKHQIYPSSFSKYGKIFLKEQEAVNA